MEDEKKRLNWNKSKWKSFNLVTEVIWHEMVLFPVATSMFRIAYIPAAHLPLSPSVSASLPAPLSHCVSLSSHLVSVSVYEFTNLPFIRVIILMWILST